SSEVTKPPTRSPVAPPATAVPCQVIGAEVVVSVPEVGAEACTPGIATNANPNKARTQRRVIRTPKEFSARQEISLENSQAERTRVCAERAGSLPAFCLPSALYV